MLARTIGGVWRIMKICMIDNSHLASIKRALNES
jgi:hypothetical protein